MSKLWFCSDVAYSDVSYLIVYDTLWNAHNMVL